MVVGANVKLADDHGNEYKDKYTYCQVQKLAAAGVKKCKQKCIPHQDYVEALINSTIKSVIQRTIVSKNHRLYTQQMTRTALSCFDVKRVILPDGISTVPYGYY